MKLSLQAKMALSFSMGLIILLIVGVTAWQANSRQIENGALVARTHRILSHTEGLLSALTEAESAARGYVITGNASYIDPFGDILQDVNAQYSHLLKLTSDNSLQQQRLFALKPLIDRRVTALTGLIEMRRQMGLAYVQERFANSNGKQWQEDIRVRVEDMERTEQALLNARAGETVLASQAARLAITLGTMFAILITVASYLVMRYDIERRTAAENALRVANTRLALATERAQNADNIKSAFLATMSHELRTPLNSIIGFSGVLLQELAGPLNAEQKKQLSMVRDSSRHLLALVNDVLDISKVEAGQLRIQRQPFALRDAIDRSIALVAPLALRKGLPIETDIVGDLGKVDNDRRRFEQVLINLLNNAVKFTEQGHIVLRAEVMPSATGDDVLRIQVIDTGIGIDAKFLPELFQPFRQIEDGLARQHEGTGLGLAICQRLLLLMGGNIAVESKLNQGSTFTVTIPRHGSAP